MPIEGVKFGYLQTKIWNAVKMGMPDGISLADIVDKIYGHLPNGGPEWANKSVPVMIYQMNLKTRLHGWVIRSEMGRHISCYRIIPASKDPKLKRWKEK